MRILIIQDYLRCGGTERQSVSFSRIFQAAGNEVCLLTLRPGGALADELPDAVSHRSLQPLDTGLNWFAPGLFRAIRKERPDVVLCMGRTANSYGGFIQRRFPNISVIGTLRTGKALPTLNLWSFRLMTGVLTNSEWWRSRLIEVGLDSSKIGVVKNGLSHIWDGNGRSTARENMRENLDVKSSTVVFLNVAGFRRGKRQALLIDLFSSLDPQWDWELWLVGDGENWSRCQRMADRLGGRRRVRLIGHLANPYACYAAADVAVSASVEDSLPNFLVEAQTLELPVIAMDFRGVGEGMRHGETGFLVGVDDRAEFLEAVHELYRRPQLRRQMGLQAQAFAAENCARERQALKTLEALQSFHSSRPFEG